jgi:hypothetical protein
MPQVFTDPELVARSEAFEAAIRGGDREALAAFCTQQEQQVRGGFFQVGTASRLLSWDAAGVAGARQPCLHPASTPAPPGTSGLSSIRQLQALFQHSSTF